MDMDSDQDAQRAAGMFNGHSFMNRPLRSTPPTPTSPTMRSPPGTPAADAGGSGREIYVVDGQVDQALKLLKRQLAKDGLFKDMKRRAFYEKPSARASGNSKRLRGSG